MENTVKERLKLYLKKNKIKAVDFCNTIGVSSGFISGMRESIQPDKLKSIAINYPTLDIRWLMTGIGSTLKDDSLQVTIDKSKLQKIYHYTTLENFAKIVKSNFFIPSSFTKANDYKEKYERNIRRKEIDKYKYLSFSTNYNNSVMWNYYADKGAGVCIEFDREELGKKCNIIKEGFVIYHGGVTHYDKQDIMDFLMEKRLDWQYENEYRLLYDSSIKQVTNILDCITGIYFGVDVDKDTIRRFSSLESLKKVYNLRQFHKGTVDSIDGRYIGLSIYYNEKNKYEDMLEEEKTCKWLLGNKTNSNVPIVRLILEAEKGAIPYYENLPVSAGQIAMVEGEEQPTGYVKIPGVSARWLFPVVGCSMKPEINPGDIVGVNAVDRWDRVDPDKIYMIVTNEERMIKRLRIDNENDEILWCISPNYPEFKILKSEVKVIYQVVFHGELM